MSRKKLAGMCLIWIAVITVAIAQWRRPMSEYFACVDRFEQAQSTTPLELYVNFLDMAECTFWPWCKPEPAGLGKNVN